MKEMIKCFTVDALKGFEGNHADKIIEEVSTLKNDTLTTLYSLTTDALTACVKGAEEIDLPETIMEHILALRTAVMQEIAERTTSNNQGAH